MTPHNAGHGRVAPAPAAEPVDHGAAPGLDRLVFHEALQVLGQCGGTGITVGRFLVQALQADRLQIGGQLGPQSRGTDRPRRRKRPLTCCVNDAFRFPAGDTRVWPRLSPYRTLARSGLPGRRPAAISRARVHLETLSRREHHVEFYGEYVGHIAFYPVFLEARRLRPSPSIMARTP